MRLLARIGTDLGVEIPLHVLLASPTVESLARWIDRAPERQGV
jgi:hypothetical protein